MKKILYVVVFITFVFALLPFMGNRVAKEELRNTLDVLRSYGVDIVNETAQEGYFTSKYQYELHVADEHKFANYLQNILEREIPSSIISLVTHMNIGIDLEFSNFPISDFVSIDIFPTALSDELKNRLLQSDKRFARSLDRVIQERVLVYHLDFHVVNRDFEGYIKSIDIKIDSDTNIETAFLLKGVVFAGEGSLLQPSKFSIQTEELKLKIDAEEQKFYLQLAALSNQGLFESASTYDSKLHIGSIALRLKNSAGEEINTEAADFTLALAVSSHAKMASLSMKSSLGLMVLKSPGGSLGIESFLYDISIDELDKDSFERVKKLAASMQKRGANISEEELSEAIVTLLSKGMKMDLRALEVQRISLNDSNMMQGIFSHADLKLHKREDLAQKIKEDPSVLSESLDLNAHIGFGKDLVALLKTEIPISAMAFGMGRAEKEEIVFDLELKSGKLKLNSKEMN